MAKLSFIIFDRVVVLIYLYFFLCYNRKLGTLIKGDGILVHAQSFFGLFFTRGNTKTKIGCSYVLRVISNFCYCTPAFVTIFILTFETEAAIYIAAMGYMFNICVGSIRRTETVTRKEWIGAHKNSSMRIWHMSQFLTKLHLFCHHTSVWLSRNITFVTLLNIRWCVKIHNKSYVSRIPKWHINWSGVSNWQGHTSVSTLVTIREISK